MSKKQVIVKTYGGTQRGATAAYSRDAPRMAQKGYYPTSQSWAPGAYGCGAFLLALLLCVVLIGILIFIYMLIVKPSGSLSVTYEFRENSAIIPEIISSEKTCPKCAEQVKAAALVCRYCGHEFSPESVSFAAAPPAPPARDAFESNSLLTDPDQIRSILLGLVILSVLVFVGRAVFDHSQHSAQQTIAQQSDAPADQTPQPSPAPAEQSDPPPQADQAPQPASVQSTFDEGHSDRLQWENWVNALTGAEQDGAIFWSGQRSLKSPEGCEAGAEEAFSTNALQQVAFQNGCQEATLRLVPSDIRRKTDPLYKAGWNAPVPAPAGNEPANNPGVSQ